MFFLLNPLGMSKKEFWMELGIKICFTHLGLIFIQRWRRGWGARSFGRYSCFWVFALLSLPFACFLTTAGDYNRWRVHLDVSLQLISSFFQFFTPAPWPPFWTPLRTPLTVGTFSQTKLLKYFREIASSLWRCRFVHSTLHCRAEGSCILEPNKFQKFWRWRRT